MSYYVPGYDELRLRNDSCCSVEFNKFDGNLTVTAYQPLMINNLMTYLRDTVFVTTSHHTGLRSLKFSFLGTEGNVALSGMISLQFSTSSPEPSMSITHSFAHLSRSSTPSNVQSNELTQSQIRGTLSNTIGQSRTRTVSNSQTWFYGSKSVSTVSHSKSIDGETGVA
eukprot:PhF_6_TR2512/c0_g1_i1/m.4279